MAAKGLVKLVEELSELIQVAAKKIHYPHTDDHPDGLGSLTTRLEDEIGDAIAAINFVVSKFSLSKERIQERAAKKLNQYYEWDREGED